MGSIREDVCGEHFIEHPQHRILVKPFLLSGFNITWAKERTQYGTRISFFFLQPEEHIKQGYGLESEILLAYSSYDTLEPRTIQAINAVLSDSPAKGRVDNLTYFIICNDINSTEWLNIYRSTKEDPRLVINFLEDELLANQNDAWYIRNQLGKQYFGRDLFDNTLPLTQDNYFFGRQQIIANYHDALKRGENKGIFGLRKTGKTSLIFKLRRIIEAERTGIFLYYDCKLPIIRTLRWYQLLSQISEDLSSKLALKFTTYDEPANSAKEFLRIIKEASLKNQNKKIVLAFDEIEYISYKAKLDKHWERDFIEFWQTIWSTQSQYKNVVVIIAGVNPSVVEESYVQGIQNPLFGIVGSEYLKGFTLEEMKIMIKSLGKRMGINFELDAYEYLIRRYGGHPLLTRLACSLVNRKIQYDRMNKPITLSRKLLESDQDNRDADLTFYCNHVISELQEFYPDEYQMLEYLSTGMVSDFIEMSQAVEYVKHLYSYGLVNKDPATNEPTIAIPVIGRYIALELAKRENRKGIFRIIPIEERSLWLVKRIQLILNDFRLLEKVIQSNNMPILFGTNSFPEADFFVTLKVVNDNNSFSSFINTVNRCFVESVENYGKSIQKDAYFWNVIKVNYPSLFTSLDRVKLYRNEKDHLVLKNGVNDKLIEVLKNDFYGESIYNYSDPWFALQQKVLDGLLSSLQNEIERLS